MKTNELFETVRSNGRVAKVLGVYSLKNLPKVRLCNGDVINLRIFANYIKTRPENEVVTFGRDDCGADFEIGYQVSPCYLVSRIHFALVCVGDMWQLLDCSLSGTTIVE